MKVEMERQMNFMQNVMSPLIGPSYLVPLVSSIPLPFLLGALVISFVLVESIVVSFIIK